MPLLLLLGVAAAGQFDQYTSCAHCVVRAQPVLQLPAGNSVCAGLHS